MIALGGLDDRALHEDVERERELVDVAQPGVGREPLEDAADVREMQRARRADRAVEVGRLEQDVHERAAFEVVALEALVEQVEDREQRLLGRRAATARLLLDPVARPPSLTLLEEREDELVLRREVPVERRLRDGRTRNHFVDSDGSNAAVREELVRAVENPLSG